MMPINPKFIDVDFAKERPKSTGFNGMGPQSELLSSYADVGPIIPESQWKELAHQLANGPNLCNLVTRIYNQRSEGSCVGNAFCQMHEVLQAKELGKDRVTALSAISLYKRIGRSAGSGAYIGDAIEEMESRGAVPLDTPENRAKFGDTVMPHTGFSTRWPGNWEATAAKFKTVEFHIVRSRAELISALFNGHPVGVGRDGHSILYLQPVYEGNRLLVKYVNSWGDWGDAGFGYDSENLIRSSAGYAIVGRAINTTA